MLLEIKKNAARNKKSPKKTILALMNNNKNESK